MANKTIFDIVTATDIGAYWEATSQERAPYVGEVLFPNKKKLGLDLEWINGNSGIPVVLNLSAFDANVIPRAREGFTLTQAKMPFFKESLYIDEEIRQQLNMAMENGSSAYVDVLTQRIFDDNIKLLEAARVQRERMRMTMLTTGAISIASNGQAVSFDYGVPTGHKATATTSWKTNTTDIMADIKSWQDKIEDDTGVRPTRAICNSSVWNAMLANTGIRNSLFVYSNGVATISDSALKAFLMEQLGLSVYVNNKRYKNEAGTATKFVADDTFVLFPEGTLGNTWFGTTPEESDLMSGQSNATVSLTDTGVAITTMKHSDPVNVETKVSMITLPSFEASGQIFIADVTP